jgi:CRP/FNR family transcriptional regulator
MLVLEGRLKLYREGEDNGEYFIYYLNPGQACALSMICSTQERQSQMMAMANEPTQVFMVPIDLMDSLMLTYKSWYYFVLETYRSRFEEVLQTIDDIAFKGMDARLEAYLHYQVKTLGTNEIQKTHQQIAYDLNSSREVISRLLKKMEINGSIVLTRSQILMK